jgi:hypothetical protein
MNAPMGGIGDMKEMHRAMNRSGTGKESAFITGLSVESGSVFFYVYDFLEVWQYLLALLLFPEGRNATSQEDTVALRGRK